MEKTIEYPIYAKNGGLFCMCRNDGRNVELTGKDGRSIDLMSLQKAALNPQDAAKLRKKKPKKCK